MVATLKPVEFIRGKKGERGGGATLKSFIKIRTCLFLKPNLLYLKAFLAA
jgi:hypothetical protein